MFEESLRCEGALFMYFRITFLLKRGQSFRRCRYFSLIIFGYNFFFDLTYYGVMLKKGSKTRK